MANKIAIAPNRAYQGITATLAFSRGISEPFDDEKLEEWFKTHGFEIKSAGELIEASEKLEKVTEKVTKEADLPPVDDEEDEDEPTDDTGSMEDKSNKIASGTKVKRTKSKSK